MPITYWNDIWGIYLLLKTDENLLSDEFIYVGALTL